MGTSGRPDIGHGMVTAAHTTGFLVIGSARARATPTMLRVGRSAAVDGITRLRYGKGRTSRTVGIAFPTASARAMTLTETEFRTIAIRRPDASGPTETDGYLPFNKTPL